MYDAQVFGHSNVYVLLGHLPLGPYKTDLKVIKKGSMRDGAVDYVLTLKHKVHSSIPDTAHAKIMVWFSFI